MALTVENDTGLSNADSYVSLVDYRAYAAARGIEGPADATDDECEQHLRKAFDYINAQWRYKSAPKNNDQAGEFPRIDLSDGRGRTFNTVPKRVKDAQCEAAILVGGGVDLFVTAERGGAVQSESIGPISTTYFQGASPDTYFQAVQRLLQPFVKDDGCPEMPLPLFNDYSGATDRPDPVFRVGMDDHTSYDTDSE